MFCMIQTERDGRELPTPEIVGVTPNKPLMGKPMQANCLAAVVYELIEPTK